MRKLIILTVSALLSLHVFSQKGEVKRLSLPEAEAYALVHNKMLLNASLAIKEAEAAKWQAIAKGLPQVNATIDYNDYFNYEYDFSGLSGGMMSPIQDMLAPLYQDVGALMLMQGLQPTLPPNTDNEPSQGGTKMNPTSTFNLRATIGFSAAYIIGIQMSKLAVDMSKINFDKSQRDTKNQVRGMYYSILITQSTINLLTSSMDNMKKMHTHTENAVKAGIAEQTDADQLAIQVYSMQNTVNASRRNVEVMTNALRLLLGLPIETEIELTENLETLDISVNTLNLLGERFEMKNNYDYRLLKQNEALAKKQYQMSGWAYAPSIGAFYQYTNKILKPNFDMSPNNVAGVTLTMPLFSSGERLAKVRQTKFALQAAQNQTEILQDQLSAQEKQLRYNITSAYENYHIQKKNIELSQQVFDKVLQKYKLGYSSSLDVTNASMTLISTQNNYVSATYELINAQLELEKLLNK